MLALVPVPGRVRIADEALPEGGVMRVAVLVYQGADKDRRSVERALVGLRVRSGLGERIEVARGT